MAERELKNEFRAEIQKELVGEKKRNRNVMIAMWQMRERISKFESRRLMIEADTAYLREAAHELHSTTQTILAMLNCESKADVVANIGREADGLEKQIEQLERTATGRFSKAQELTLESLLKAKMYDEQQEGDKAATTEGKDAEDEGKDSETEETSQNI